jgi:hypothetical protein
MLGHRIKKYSSGTQIATIHAGSTLRYVIKGADRISIPNDSKKYVVHSLAGKKIFSNTISGKTGNPHILTLGTLHGVVIIRFF